jgi:hypothetical protein
VNTGNKERGIIGRTKGGSNREDDRLCIAQTAGEDTMEKEVLGGTKLVMDGEGECITSGMSV